MFDNCQRRWPSIKTASGQHLVDLHVGQLNVWKISREEKHRPGIQYVARQSAVNLHKYLTEIFFKIQDLSKKSTVYGWFWNVKIILEYPACASRLAVSWVSRRMNSLAALGLHESTQVVYNLTHKID